MSIRKIKGSNLPSININKQSLLLLNRLTGDEIKTILQAIQQYVYKGEDVVVDEDLECILESVLDNIDNIAKGYLNKANASRENGKKGGRPRKNTHIENKPISSPSNDADDKIYPQEVETAENGLKSPNTDILITMTSTEFDMPSIPATAEVRSLPKKDKIDNNTNITEEENKEMGNVTNIQLNPATGKFEYTKEQKENIKNKIVNNSIPRPINNTAITTSTPSNSLTFEEVLKAESYNIKTIISDFNTPGLRQKVQGPENLKELLNRYRLYRNELIGFISKYVEVDILAA